MAPGVNLLGPYLDNGYSRLTGSSMSTPLVAGIATLKKSLQPDLNKEKCIEYFKKTSKDIGKPGWDKYTGYGVIQPGKFLNIKESTQKKNWYFWLLALIALFLNRR